MADSRIRSLGRQAGPIAVIATCILPVMVLIGILEPYLPTAAAKVVGSGPRRAPPSGEWMFGTDTLGRSIFARILEGIRLTFVLSATAVVLAGIVGSVIGMAAAWRSVS